MAVRMITDDPIARAFELFGDRWTLQIVREVFRGTRRFGRLQRRLGIARTVLSARLALLVEHGILERERYHRDPDWFEYRLTARGRALYPAIAALGRWADEHLPEQRAS
jgi:DNA-binding HxlR family transcriptional regulator